MVKKLNHMKAKVSIALLFILMVLIIFPGQARAIDSSRLFQDPDNPNIYYFVGMVYYDVWKNSAGTWTGDGHKPGDTVSRVDGGPYEFTFPAGRKLKDITITAYDFNWRYADETFNTSRTGELAINNKEYYLRATSTSPYSYDNSPVHGKGTNSGKIDVYVINGVLNAVREVDRRYEEEQNGQTFAPGVEGWRFFFPTLFTIELEPTEGKAIIKHYTTAGQSLDGVDGFRDREEKIELNQHYTFFPSPNTQTYKYKYYTKGTDRPLPSVPNPADILHGNPMAFTYNGGYPVYYLNLYYEGDPPTTTDPPPGVVCTAPSPSRTMTGEDFNPNVSAVIKADSRGSERFNVLDGIPTTESLYGNSWTKNYLHKYAYQELRGQCTFTVDVTVMPPPPPPGEAAGSPSTVQVQVDKDYSYWTVTQVEVYQIKEAALWNYAFDGNGIRIQPTGYNAPYYATAQSRHYEPSDVPSVSVSHDGDPQAAAESAVSVRVRNDTFTFYNQTLMSGAETTGSGPTPSPIPTAPMTGDNVLYSPGNVVPMSKTNKASQPSTGTVYYSQVSGAAEKNYPIYGINPVTVHTPVVIYPNVSNDKAHNQKTKPAAGRSAIILDRPFTIDMPNSGQHTNYLGYGNRNYLKYIGSKQVRFPFDVYDGTKTRFYPKNTWIEVEKSQESFTFFLPVWVDEGFYDVEFRTIAHNAPAGASHQTNANLDLTHHIAYDTVPVDAIGRVYDFRITDIADFNWESVFRVEKGSPVHTGALYWIGLNGIDGDPRGNAERYTLPIRPGSHPVYKNVAIRTGYHFKFDFKTKGNMMDKLDGVRITPTFYFVTKDGKTRVPVDLYYHTSTKNFIKVGSADDKIDRYVILNERLRNVTAAELTDTASYKYDHYYTPGQLGTTSKTQYTDRYINKYTKEKTPVGWLKLMIFPEQIRTFIGPKATYLGQPIPASVDKVRSNVAVQKWYGEYSLPAAPYVVQKDVNLADWAYKNGMSLTDKSPIFLKNGYIIVNFNIETIQDGDTAEPYLQYIHAPAMQPTGSQWQLEGFKSVVKDSYDNQFSLKQGDIVFYHADKSSRDDFKSTVPH